MEKYKNKDGIELSYTGNDSHQVLVREVIGEAIKILGMYDRNCKISMGMAMSNTRKFLRDNFDLHDSGDRSDEWRIKQFNRNRDSSEWVHTIKELEDRIDKIFKD